uniref:Peptidase S8 pro-domain domain-containing protein n=1 Tax=Anguilla anguilla TaxID=7936 RepID=A0A0E9TMX0_ANGAN
MGQIGDLKDYYHFFHSRTIKRSTLSSRGGHSFITMEPTVEWIEHHLQRRRELRPQDHNHRPAAALYGQSHWNLGVGPDGCWDHRPLSGGKSWTHLA